MPLQPLQFAPGIVKDETEYASEGRYIDCDKIRFKNGQPEKIGGWSKLTTQTLTGAPRALAAWSTNDQTDLIATVTSERFYIYKNGYLNDRTPYRYQGTGTLSNAITTNSGSNIIEIAHSTHGLAENDWVRLFNVTINNITLNGDFKVNAVLNANSYKIIASTNANATATGVGGNLNYAYYMPVGNVSAFASFGYGTGTWNQGSYGTPRTGGTGITLALKTFTMDNWGEDLVFCPSGDRPYYYDSSNDTSQIVSANTPDNNQGIVVTEQRHLVCFGADGDPMKVAWSDQEDFTQWTPASDNDAGSNLLSGGTIMVGAKRLRGGNILLWSDTTAFLMQFTADTLIFNFNIVGTNCGLIAPKASVEVGGLSFWMTKQSFFMYDGYSKKLNSSAIERFVFDDFNFDQRSKVFAAHNSKHDEVWWFYPSQNSNFNNRYVIYNMKEGTWSIGSMDRSAWIDAPTWPYPLAANEDGTSYIYQHELGKDDDGSAMDCTLQTAPLDIGDGEQIADLFGWVPDFEDQSGQILLTVELKDKPNSVSEVIGPYGINATTEKIDMRNSARSMSFKLQSNVLGGHYRMGKNRIDIAPAGRRR